MPRGIERRVDQFTPVASTVMRRRMPIGTTVGRYVCRFTGTLTVGVAAATILEDSPYGFLRSIDLVLNGSFPLRALDGRGYFFINRVQYGTPPQVTAPLAAVGASAFVAELTIDLLQQDLRGNLKYGFLLDTRLLSSVELVFTFGADADVATPGGGGTAVTSALSMDVYAEEFADVGGPTSRMQMSRIQQAIAATGALDVQLPALGPIYRAIALHFTSGNADPLRATSDDTILTDASLIADNVLRHVDTSPYRMLRADNKFRYSLETMPAGWVILDFAKEHNLDNVIRTARTRQLIARLNIGAAPANTFVQVYPLNSLLVVRGVRRQAAPAGNGAPGVLVGPR